MGLFRRNLSEPVACGERRHAEMGDKTSNRSLSFGKQSAWVFPGQSPRSDAVARARRNGVSERCPCSNRGYGFSSPEKPYNKSITNPDEKIAC